MLARPLAWLKAAIKGFVYCSGNTSGIPVRGETADLDLALVPGHRIRSNVDYRCRYICMFVCLSSRYVSQAHDADLMRARHVMDDLSSCIADCGLDINVRLMRAFRKLIEALPMTLSFHATYTMFSVISLQHLSP